MLDELLKSGDGGQRRMCSLNDSRALITILATRNGTCLESGGIHQMLQEIKNLYYSKSEQITFLFRLTRSSLDCFTLALPLMPTLFGRGPSWKISRMNSFSCSWQVMPGPITAHRAEY